MPINGALLAPAVSYPGVNAWATEKGYDEIGFALENAGGVRAGGLVSSVTGQIFD